MQSARFTGHWRAGAAAVRSPWGEPDADQPATQPAGDNLSTYADSESQALGGIEHEQSMAARAPCSAM